MYTMKFIKGELFCGPGGLALGCKEAVSYDEFGEKYNIEHGWANDIDENACNTYVRNICPDQPDTVYCEDVRTFIRDKIHLLPKINAFTFGFPCNDFSIVGEHKGTNGEYGPLYSYGVRVLDYFKPDFFIAENVGGLQSANDGNAFIQILEEIQNAGDGYKITPHLYKFEEYGVPQMRHRIIIVGIKKGIPVKFKVPAPTHKKYVTAREVLEAPPIPADAPNHEFTKHNKKVVEMLQHIPPGENAWCENIPDHLRLNVKKVRMSQIYRRLHPDKPSYTITGSGGGGTHGYHWNEHRALTNRERARLQTFKDDFIFEGSKEAVRKQIGMAVPPAGAKVILEAVLNTFAGNSYPSIPPKWDFEEMKARKKSTVHELKEASI